MSKNRLAMWASLDKEWYIRNGWVLLEEQNKKLEAIHNDRN
ncbi:hypothetical protein AB4Y30_12500 [Ornithinibacillus sp. 4-3]|uniref:Uncharacterized protein n=1 Tax=Ornithinibacillus sp. 4-3 TaxID=3231488 RepID=A0AB39HPW9_9BACI